MYSDSDSDSESEYIPTMTPMEVALLIKAERQANRLYAVRGAIPDSDSDDDDAEEINLESIMKKAKTQAQEGPKPQQGKKPQAPPQAPAQSPKHGGEGGKKKRNRKRNKKNK